MRSFIFFILAMGLAACDSTTPELEPVVVDAPVIQETPPKTDEVVAVSAEDMTSTVDPEKVQGKSDEVKAEHKPVKE